MMRAISKNHRLPCVVIGRPLILPFLMRQSLPHDRRHIVSTDTGSSKCLWLDSYIVISPLEVDYSFAILPSRTTSSPYNNVGNGSTNISLNGAVTHGNVKGHRHSKEINACCDDV